MKFRRNDKYYSNACLPKAATGRGFSPLPDEVKNKEFPRNGTYPSIRCPEPTALRSCCTLSDGLKSILTNENELRLWVKVHE